MFDLNITYDTFGGRKKVMEGLFELGLLNDVCPGCNRKVHVQYEQGNIIPRIACTTCKSRPSCATNTALQWNKIRDIPVFLFVARCFALHMSTAAMVSLSGADYRTVRDYIACIQKALCAKIKKMREDGELKLGGPGKVVEVDEMLACGRKYGRGRKLEKEGVWILGLTEVDVASHPIENPAFLKQLSEREEEREEAARQRQEKRKRRKVAKKAAKRRCPAPSGQPPSCLSCFSHSSEPFEVERSEGIDGEFISGNNEGNREVANEDDGIDIVHVGPDVEENEDSLSRIELENQLRRLFSQSRKNKPKRTLFFVLPDRSKETLHKFIVENVLPGSTIDTDEWRGYNGLEEKGFIHKTICHQRRFSRFEIDGTLVTRITINHIERMWVELRRTLKYMNKDTFIEMINLETYRQLFLFNSKSEECVKAMLRDFAMTKPDE